MRSEWMKSTMTQLFVLLLFISLNAEIMSWFDDYILPILSIVNEGIASSIIFMALCLAVIVFWFNRFKHHYYVKPLFVLSSISISSVYWYYRLFTSNYVIIASDLFHIGFSDIFFGGVFLFGLISLLVDFTAIKEPATNEINEGIIPLLEDIPISRKDQDVLGFGDEVDTLYQRIVEHKTTSALSIGINARWGDGKSSFINLMEEKFLQNKDRFIVIRFNPRYSTNNTIQSAFFENLYSVLSKYDARFKDSFNDYLKVIDVMADNKYLSALFHTSTLFNRENEKARINKAIMRLKKRIVIIIEDLDRLMADEIIEVLKLIDGNAAFNNLIFISAYDKNRINSLLETGDISNTYSDKFFTWERHLPLRSSKLLLNYLIPNLVSGLNFKNEEVDEIKNSIMTNSSLYNSYLKNLRDVKRYINLVKPSLNRIYKELKIRDFLLIELVRYKYPEEHRLLYEQNSHKDNELNFERKITIDGLEEKYQSKDILKLLFPANGDSSYRTINSIGGFSIYFQEQIFECVSNEQLNLMFDNGQDYRAIIKDILDNKGWNQLNGYLSSLNTFSFSNWDDVVRYIDIYIYLSAQYNERLYSTINVGVLIEKKVAERLCKQFEISMDNYKSTIYQRLIGGNNEYPYEIVKLQLWAYKKGEIRHELIFTENELLTILKNSLKELVKINPGYTALHRNILSACISFIDPTSKKVILDSEACEMVLGAIKSQPESYLNDFVFLAGVSSSPDWNSITCDPFWRQIFGSKDNIKDFIFDTKFDTLLNIDRVRNFWSIYEMNNYEPIEFQDQGPVQEKIDSNLVNERKLLNELLKIESDVNSIAISQDKIVNAYKVLKDALARLDSNTLYIKKNGDVRASIIKKRDELKLLRESEHLKITQEVLGKIQLYENFINEHLRC